MLIASTDIETTGLDPEYCQVLEVGVVLWETSDLDTPVADLPSFHCYVVHERTVGEPFALSMNQRILQRIAKQEAGFQYLTPQDVGSTLFDWLQNHSPNLYNPNLGSYEVTPTGFNFDSFDRQFLDRIPYFTDWIRFGHRSLGPGTLFFDPLRDEKLPSSDEVFRRAGVTVVDRHTALGDARGVIEVLRAAFREGGPRPAPLRPRCPNCGDRQSLVVPGRGADWVELPCPICVPKACWAETLDSEILPNRVAQYLEPH
jgi:hypothetical protein